MVSMAQWVGQQCFEAVGMRFESQPLPTFFNSITTTENRDTAPLLCVKSFVTFHVTMTAEARSLSQKDTQELYLK